MTYDGKHDDRYFTVCNSSSVTEGFEMGWQIYHAGGSPSVETTVKTVERTRGENQMDVGPLNLPGLWPDTDHYDQNSPGIMAKAEDVDARLYRSWAEQSFWLNVLRVPISAQYLAACAKCRPKSILELGTGGDSAHSTGMFLLWLEGEFGSHLVSVDRHPLSHTWLRYRHNQNWRFVQGDSVRAMQALIDGLIKGAPRRYDVIFIDSSHLYAETLTELEQAAQMTDAILLDDSNFPGVAAALKEWLPKNPDWLRCDFGSTVAYLERHVKKGS